MTNIGTQGGSSPLKRKANHWIEFRVKNKDTGKLIKGVNIFVKFGDGSTHALSTWTNGRAHFEYIPEGPCDLLKCELGHELVEEKETYVLKDGDSLHDIADREMNSGNEITWEDIAAINWGEGARDSHVANQHMRDTYGCTRYLFWKNYEYNKKDGKTHTLIIPKRIRRTGLAIDQVYEILVNISQTKPQFLACASIPNVTFETSRSFVRPNAAVYLKKLKEIVNANPNSMMMIFGHTDKVGTEDFNKALSERRAKSAYALLIKKPDYWVTLFEKGNGPDNEDWGLKSVQTILNFLNPDAQLDITNTMDDRTVKELETYTEDPWTWRNRVKVITPNALKMVVQKYMDTLMDGVSLTESDFFGLKHAGCSVFNPIIDIDQAEEDNRRVTFFLFDQNRLPEIPCSNTDLAPCRSQSSQYRQNPRHTYRHNDSFSCAFYDSIAKECEGEMKLMDIIAFDSHMHFMSGHCTPMPLLWNQFPGKPQIKRSNLDKAGGWVLRYTAGKLPIPKVAGTIKGAWTQRQSTLAIADMGIAQNESIYKKTYSKDLARSKGRELFTPMIAMPMDMAYAHIDGYKGGPIYHLTPIRKYFMMEIPMPEGSPTWEKVFIWPDEVCKGRDDLLSETKVTKEYPGVTIITEDRGHKARREGFYYFWSRDCVLEDEDILWLSKYDAAKELKKRTPVWLPAQERDLFEDWAAQKEATMTAAIKYPFKYMPMYHYDPRRWSALDNLSRHQAGPSQDQAEKKAFLSYDEPRNWDEPFADIATPNKAGTFIGFKMYSALGYKPLDPKLAKTLNKFYEKCQKDGIPILCHCSPSGMYSHDRSFYFDRELRPLREKYMTEKRDFPKFWKKYENFDNVMGFYDEFVRPSTWETQVLSTYKKLKLCLAHFGGGSSDWKDWKDDTANKRQRMLMDDPYGTTTITPQQEETFISTWYLDETPKPGVGKPKRWIREIVDMMVTYENFYADISYHFVKDHKKQLKWLIKTYPHVKERVLFGTDWYMTELDDLTINKFVHNAKTALDEITQELEEETNIKDDLWLKFSRINPMKFFGIRGIADNFAKGLEAGVVFLEKKTKDEKSLTTKKTNVVLNNSALERNLEIIKRSDLF